MKIQSKYLIKLQQIHDVLDKDDLREKYDGFLDEQIRKVADMDSNRFKELKDIFISEGQNTERLQFRVEKLF